MAVGCDPSLPSAQDSSDSDATATSAASAASDGAADGAPVADDGNADAGPSAPSGDPTSGGGERPPDDDGGVDADDGGPPPIKLDVGGMPDGGVEGLCAAPMAVTCDGMDDDPWHALGLNCPGGPQVDGSINLAGPSQLHVHAGNLGTFVPPPFPPQEGNKFVILSSGNAVDLTIPGANASTNVGGATALPPPIQTQAVAAGQDCVDNPALIGSGDCSNTIQEQWDQGSGSNDYAEMRFTVEVPGGTFGFTYDFAMFSTEYPVFYQSSFNDMYIAWLESEQWTGNISFDESGNPISLNAGFLDFKDAPNDIDCPAPCQAPELQGTAMQGHAGTRWLTTTAGVQPGEIIEVVFGVFDLSDGILDTMVILDNFQWSCEGGAPVTIPG